MWSVRVTTASKMPARSSVAKGATAHVRSMMINVNDYQDTERGIKGFLIGRGLMKPYETFSGKQLIGNQLFCVVSSRGKSREVVVTLAYK